jgi:hypothetical protein
MKSILTIQEAQQAINELQNRLDTAETKNWDRRQTRITNAHPSVDPYDYVVRKELDAISPTIVQSSILGDLHKATFGIFDATLGTDKTLHFFVLYAGQPKIFSANAKVAPAGSPLYLTLQQKETDGGTWTDLLNPYNPLIIPVGSTWIHTITTFATGAALKAGSLLRINITQGDSLLICRDVEAILRW